MAGIQTIFFFHCVLCRANASDLHAAQAAIQAVTAADPDASGAAAALAQLSAGQDLTSLAEQGKAVIEQQQQQPPPSGPGGTPAPAPAPAPAPGPGTTPGAPAPGEAPPPGTPQAGQPGSPEVGICGFASCIDSSAVKTHQGDSHIEPILPCLQQSCLSPRILLCGRGAALSTTCSLHAPVFVPVVCMHCSRHVCPERKNRCLSKTPLVCLSMPPAAMCTRLHESQLPANKTLEQVVKPY